MDISRNFKEGLNEQPSSGVVSQYLPFKCSSMEQRFQGPL